jgi:hypothetical protein
MATKFVDKMNEAYGVSRKTLMNSQAIFKNMIGALGLVSEEGAYAISEGITQMAIDYSSLYNVTLESAMTRFQSALAGQVRPIRSIAGYDITETTIYQLYQQLGGTKTMRQLNRTEKQLLSIYAIFNQMDRSGAVGDMAKTIESYANQARVMKESWTELKTWIGTLLTYWVEQNNILVTINKYLIYFSEILKAVAVELDAITSFGGDPFAGTEDSANSASQAVDELNGRLLDFDKFRALDTSKGEDMALDETVLSTLSSYTSILETATMRARELANEMLKANGWFTEDGVFNFNKWIELREGVEAFGNAILSIVIGGGIIKLINLITSLTTTTGLLTTALNLLSNVAIVGLVFLILEAIDAFKDGDIAMGIVATTIGVALVSAIIMLKGVLVDGMVYVELFGKVLNASFLAPLAGITALIAGITSLVDCWGDMGGWQKAITIITALASAVIGAWVAIKAFQLSVPVALGLGATLAGGVLLIGSQLAKGSVQKFANGGMPDKGTMFVAGEAGAEIVYNTPSGQSGVANISQIEQAMYGALVRYGKTQSATGQPIEVYLDGEKVYQNTTAHAKMHGNGWGKA